ALRAVMLRALWFFGGAIVTFVTFLLLSRNNVTGTREEPPQVKPGVAFTLDKTGAALLAELTRKNVPSEEDGRSPPLKRHLAIILDGLVTSAPTINSEISSHGQITGDFSEEEVDNLVNILRAGALWGPRLQPRPVEEKTIDDGTIPAAKSGTVLVNQIV